jgi:hypothetical protein
MIHEYLPYQSAVRYQNTFAGANVQPIEIGLNSLEAGNRATDGCPFDAAACLSASRPRIR